MESDVRASRLWDGLMSALPTDGKWTQRRRDQWLATVTSVADLLIDIAPETEVGESALDEYGKTSAIQNESDYQSPQATRAHA